MCECNSINPDRRYWFIEPKRAEPSYWFFLATTHYAMWSNIDGAFNWSILITRNMYRSRMRRHSVVFALRKKKKGKEREKSADFHSKKPWYICLTLRKNVDQFTKKTKTAPDTWPKQISDFLLSECNVFWEKTLLLMWHWCGAFDRLREIKVHSKPTLSQLWSLKIRQSTFLKYTKFVDLPMSSRPDFSVFQKSQDDLLCRPKHNER